MKKKKKKVAKRAKPLELQASVEQDADFHERHAWSYFRPRKTVITLRLDADVLAWFRKQGRGYQTRINRALREVMRSDRNKRESQARG